MSLLCYGLGTEVSSCIQLRMCGKKMSVKDDKLSMKKVSIKLSKKRTKIKIKVCPNG